jgi:hypothetical protein
MSRKIKVNKQELIKKIELNKEMHLTDYEEAVEAYKDEALRQLKELTKKAKAGERNLNLDLVEPINNEKEYDKLLLMFEMEVEDEVELDMHEFNQYVHDETQFAMAAGISNKFYSSKF